MADETLKWFKITVYQKTKRGMAYEVISPYWFKCRDLAHANARVDEIEELEHLERLRTTVEEVEYPPAYMNGRESQPLKNWKPEPEQPKPDFAKVFDGFGNKIQYNVKIVAFDEKTREAGNAATSG